MRCLAFAAVIAVVAACHHAPTQLDKIRTAGELAQSQQRWDDAVAKLEAALGPANEIVDRPTMVVRGWAASDGDDCALFEIIRRPDHPVVDMVGVSTDSASDRASCVKIARAR